MIKWNEYINDAKEDCPWLKEDIEQAEVWAALITQIIKRREELGISQRELAQICEIPQSSIARMETFTNIPKVSTVMKVIKPLGLKLQLVNT